MTHRSQWCARPAFIVLLLIELAVLAIVEGPALVHSVKVIKHVDALKMKSELLSTALGSTQYIRASVILPPSYEDSAQEFPVMFHIPGFGGDDSDADDNLETLQAIMLGHPELEMVHVFLDPSGLGGHHYFVDSDNNGPWATALMREFVPFLEKKFRINPNPRFRFLTGHSSGGWTSLWLQISFPDLFGGVWSTSPDPVDFRDFFLVDVTPGSKDNMYVDENGKSRPAYRTRHTHPQTLQQYIEEDEEEERGEFASYEWAWSPRGPKGEPLQLFDRKTGALNPVVQKAWERFDIRKVLESNWEVLGPKLAGKLHIYCGGRDDYFLNDGVEDLCDFLNQHKFLGICEIIPTRNHRNLYLPHVRYPEGLELLINQEAAEVARSATSEGQPPADAAQGQAQ